MIEASRFIEAEQERCVVIRFHHLELWEAVAAKFKEHFDKKNPLDILARELPQVKNFLKKNIENEMEVDIRVRQYFESVVIENLDMERDFWYINDVIGVGEDVHQLVLAGRLKYFNDILDLSSNDGTAKIRLVKNSDGYCKSCAIGNHCKQEAAKAGQIDWDLIYEDVLVRFLEMGTFNHFASGMLGRDINGLYITPGLLFDTEFHKLLQDEIRKIDTAVYTAQVSAGTIHI